MTLWVLNLIDMSETGATDLVASLGAILGALLLKRVEIIASRLVVR